VHQEGGNPRIVPALVKSYGGEYGYNLVSIYREFQAVAPGKFDCRERPRHPDPPSGHVLIRVEACGVCHSDAANRRGIFSDRCRAYLGTRLWGNRTRWAPLSGGWTVVTASASASSAVFAGLTVCRDVDPRKLGKPGQSDGIQHEVATASDDRREPSGLSHSRMGLIRRAAAPTQCCVKE